MGGPLPVSVALLAERLANRAGERMHGHKHEVLQQGVCARCRRATRVGWQDEAAPVGKVAAA